MRMMTSAVAVVAAAVAVASMGVDAATAQGYPTRPIIKASNIKAE